MENQEDIDEVLKRIESISFEDLKPSDFELPSASKNCLSYWYPKIEGHVPTPKTTIIKTPDNGWDLVELMEGGKCDYFESLCDQIAIAAKEVGYPAFLRTGQTSGKHNWEDCCFLANADRIMHHVFKLVEWSSMVDLLGLPHDVWVVREMLPTTHLFRCTAYGNMPVVAEWRCFVDGDRILYVNPYWPEDALEQGVPDDPHWRRFLGTLNCIPSESELELAKIAGGCVGGKWSVDMLPTENGWYVTDMAEAHRSYGWDEKRAACVTG